MVIAVTLDSTFIRSCADGERHLEVRVGNVETETGGHQVFGAVAKAGTNIRELIRRSLDAVGRTKDTALTAFTDGYPGFRRILADAGVAEPPILDWFHIAMRLQHLKQIASALAVNDPARVAAKAVIVEEIERLHWRIWNGKARDAQVSVNRIRTVMHHFQGEPDQRRSTAPSRKLWTALHALDGYLTGQSAWLVNYAERHHAGLRVGTAITEGTANFLVNRRMNKSQQMRWSRRGADLLLQVRCAVYNGTLGSGFGQKFHPANDPYPPTAIAACPQSCDSPPGGEPGLLTLPRGAEPGALGRSRRGAHALGMRARRLLAHRRGGDRRRRHHQAPLRHQDQGARALPRPGAFLARPLRPGQRPALGIAVPDRSCPLRTLERRAGSAA